MAETEPAKARRLAIGVGVIALLAAGAVALLRDRGAGTLELPPPVTAAEVPAAVSGPPTPAPPTPIVAVLNRAELLKAVGEAASAYEEGAGGDRASPPLAGRRFLLRVPFGCPGADGAGAESASWAVTPDGGALKVTVRPETWTDSPFAQALGGEGVEAVEGFWIPQPWRMSETCSARRSDPLLPEPPQPSPQTVGLAAVFGPESSRVARRGDRPYELTLASADAERPGPQGLQLVLEGRVTAFSDGRAIACRSAGPAQRPVCLVAAQIERVAVRNPASDRLLGEWRDGTVLSPAPPSAPAGSAAPAPQD